MSKTRSGTGVIPRQINQYSESSKPDHLRKFQKNYQMCRNVYSGRIPNIINLSFVDCENFLFVNGVRRNFKMLEICVWGFAMLAVHISAIFHQNHLKFAAQNHCYFLNKNCNKIHCRSYSFWVILIPKLHLLHKSWYRNYTTYTVYIISLKLVETPSQILYWK